jgi:SP family general alpha glucoside:H+ symporter-like MFS transporter
MVLIFFAPESPWWLVRRGRRDQALKSIKRLGRRNGTQANAEDTLSMIERTVQIEKHTGGEPGLLDLVKGTDLRRTIITCLIYASQNFAGNLIAYVHLSNFLGWQELTFMNQY